ncbi:hypothetical protein D6833_11245, partial [Candidatus Parcubacteria bacterium]
RLKHTVEESGLGTNVDITPMALRLLPGTSKPDGSGTWTQREVQDLVRRANAGDPEASVTLNHLLTDLVRSPEFVRNLGVAPTPTDAGAVRKFWRASRNEIEAHGEETVEHMAEKNREDARAFGKVNPSGKDLTPTAVRREIETRGSAIQFEANKRSKGAEARIDADQDRIRREGERIEQDARHATDGRNQNLLGNALEGAGQIIPTPVKGAWDKVRDWLTDEEDGKAESDDKPAEREDGSRPNRRRSRH